MKAIKYYFKISAMTIMVLLPLLSKSQASDSTKKNVGKKMWNLDVMARLDLPAADMAKRFGVSNQLGFGIKHKSAKNVILGAKAEFIFGNKIKEDSLLINVKTEQGFSIAASGELLNIGLFQRGYTLGFQAGKILPIWNPNSNSGPMLLTTIGFMQHKIKLYDIDNAFPQVNGAYKKGYDRLTNGLFLEQFVGYAYYSDNKFINFFAGFDINWGFTKGRRSYLFDVARPDDASRNDILIGFKLGWVLPIIKKNSDEIYY